MVGRVLLLLGRGDVAPVLGAHHDPVSSPFKVLGVDERGAFSRRLDGRLVDEVLQVGAREAWSAASDDGQIEMRVDGDFARVELEDLDASSSVGQGDGDVPVEPVLSSAPVVR